MADGAAAAFYARPVSTADMDVYRARRDRIAARIRPHNGVLLLHGGALRSRSNDTEFPFRPDSDFHYLTGLCEPCLLYTSPSPRDQRGSRMPSSA